MKKLISIVSLILAFIIVDITFQSENVNITNNANAQVLECPNERCRESFGCDYSAPGRKCTYDYGICSGYEYCE